MEREREREEMKIKRRASCKQHLKINFLLVQQRWKMFADGGDWPGREKDISDQGKRACVIE